MPRVLVLTERSVTGAARDTYLGALSVRRAQAAAAGANFWVFEKIEDQEQFIEFVEAGSEDALAAAFATSQPDSNGYDPADSPAPVWREVRGI